MKQKKAIFRKEMLSKRAAIHAEDREHFDAAIADHIMLLPEYGRAETIFCYVSVNGEPDTRKLMTDALARGKRVCVPLCLSMGVMEARLVVGDEDLQSGKYDIPEPKRDCPVIPPEEIDLIITPCVCCDRGGYRLGYGGGFYDRWLEKRTAPAIVLCYEVMMVSAVPREMHDCKADIVVSDASVYDFR